VNVIVVYNSYAKNNNKRAEKGGYPQKINLGDDKDRNLKNIRPSRNIDMPITIKKVAVGRKKGIGEEKIKKPTA